MAVKFNAGALVTLRRFYSGAIHDLSRADGFLVRWTARIFFLRHRKNRLASILADWLVSRPIRETLALDTLHGKHRTFPIVHAKRDAV